MFAILIPVSIGPLIVTLLWAERKAARLGLVPVVDADPSSSSSSLGQRPKKPIWHRAAVFADKLDVVGLTLLAAGIALILLPLTLAETAKGKWKNGMYQSPISPKQNMLIAGCL